MYFRIVLCSLNLLLMPLCYAMEKPISLKKQFLKAIENEDKVLASSLLVQGANPNYVFKFYKGPTWPVYTGKRIKYMSHHESYQTPLSIAAKKGDKDMVCLLLASGAQVTHKNCRKSPLRRAAKYGHKEIVRILLDAGADCNYRDKPKPGINPFDGKTALDDAVNKAQWDSAFLLVERGARHIHIKSQLFPLFKELLIIRAKNIPLCDLNCKLIKAAKEGNYQDAEEALKHGADPNGYARELIGKERFWDAKQVRPLYQAVFHNHKALINLLIKCKASIVLDASEDDTHGSIIDHAISTHHSACVEELLQAGALPGRYSFSVKYLLEKILIEEDLFVKRCEILKLLCMYGYNNQSEGQENRAYPLRFYPFSGSILQTMRENSHISSVFKKVFSDPLEYAALTGSYFGVQKCLTELQSRARARNQNLLPYCLSVLGSSIVPLSLRAIVTWSDDSIAYTQEERAQLSRALMYAVGQNRKEVVKLLLDFGTDPFEALALIKIILMREGSKCGEKRCQIYKFLLERALQKIVTIARFNNQGQQQNYLQVLPQELIKELFLFLTRDK